MQDYPFQPVTWGAEPHDFTKQAGGDHALNLGVYTNETTKRYIEGTRSLTWDGRVYRYAKCGYRAIPNNKFGVNNFTILVACNVAAGPNNNAVVVADTAVGETKMKVTFDPATLGNSQSIRPKGVGAVAGQRDGILYEHELCGGYISLYTGVYRQQRGIVGNTALTATETSMIIYLDAPLDHELLASTCEILSNPYMCVGEGNVPMASIVGVSMVPAAVDDYVWLQTWGPLRVTHTGGSYGTALDEREWVFIGNGAIMPNTVDSSDHAFQHAGFLIEQTYGQNDCAAPFIMLQISP